MTIRREMKNERKETKPVLHLVGENGNAFMLLGLARRCAKENGMDWDKIQSEATSGDYDHLLQVLCTYFDVE
jgi:hypothetical protein